MDLSLFDKPGLWNATAMAASATTSLKTPQTEGREQLLLTLALFCGPQNIAVSFAYARKINDSHLYRFFNLHHTHMPFVQHYL
jgi:hypothetical protein